MTGFKRVLLVCGLGWASAGSLHLTTPAHASSALPPAVRQEVAAAVAQWSGSGDIGGISTAIADLCNENPGVALDIVGYAGEAAISGQLPQRCLIAGSTCEELEQLLALLLAHAMRLTGDRMMASLPPATDAPLSPVTSMPPAAADGERDAGPAPDETAGPPAGEAQPNEPDDAAGSPPGDGGNTGGSRPPGESTGGPPCQASGTCGGEPPPASYTAL